MLKILTTASLFAALLAGSAGAIVVNAGDTIRGSYDTSTLAATQVTPSSFFLRLANTDAFGNGDSIGIRLLDGAGTALTFTQFDAVGAALDPTVGIPFSLSDFLPGAIALGAPSVVPSAGFVEITGLAGSFDVLSLDVVALEAFGSVNVLRRDRVTAFEPVITTPPASVPLPASLLFLGTGLMGGFALRRKRVLSRA